MEDNKYKNWVFTWNEGSDPSIPLVSSELLDRFLKTFNDSYVFQIEVGENTHRKHYQGCFRCKIRIRQQTLLKKFVDEFSTLANNLTITRMCGTWDEAMSYSSKTETAVPNTLILSKDLQNYDGKEINFLANHDNRYPWQSSLISILYDKGEISIQTPDDRSIIWITDKKGNSGKSKLVKYLCFNSNDIVKISFGTAGQLRSSVISIGPRKVYIVDIPRTLGEDDSIPALISALEDIKNGYIVSAMYGKHQQLMMDPPHIVIFTNADCPHNMMSADRWKSYNISEEKELSLNDKKPWCSNF